MPRQQPEKPRAPRARKTTTPIAEQNESAAIAPEQSAAEPTPDVARPGPIGAESEAARVAHHDRRLVSLRGDLAARQQHGAAMEQSEKARARTPLSLELVVSSCLFAVEKWTGDRTIPEITFPTAQKCVQGKQLPDQDCRFCKFYKPIAYGSSPHMEPHTRRYSHHGMIIPIPDEESAQVIAGFIAQRGHLPLRSVQAEIAALEAEIVKVESEVEGAKRAEIEEMQRGRAFF